MATVNKQKKSTSIYFSRSSNTVSSKLPGIFDFFIQGTNDEFSTCTGAIKTKTSAFDRSIKIRIGKAFAISNDLLRLSTWTLFKTSGFIFYRPLNPKFPTFKKKINTGVRTFVFSNWDHTDGKSRKNSYIAQFSQFPNFFIWKSTSSILLDFDYQFDFNPQPTTS